VTATKSWGPTPAGEVGREVDSQVAAPTETRTPNLHRANIAHQRVRMEGWRQGRLGSREDHSTTKGNYKTDLTLTGLLMEGPIAENLLCDQTFGGGAWVSGAADFSEGFLFFAFFGFSVVVFGPFFIHLIGL
jgi:hypothetical protein